MERVCTTHMASAFQGKKAPLKKAKKERGESFGIISSSPMHRHVQFFQNLAHGAVYTFTKFRTWATCRARIIPWQPEWAEKMLAKVHSALFNGVINIFKVVRSFYSSYLQPCAEAFHGKRLNSRKKVQCDTVISLMYLVFSVRACAFKLVFKSRCFTFNGKHFLLLQE